MQITQASEGAPGLVNEDYAVCGSSWAVLLDGATAPLGVNSGCIHDVPWLVRHLAAALTRRMLTEVDAPLDDLLASSIEEVSAAHAGTCDLDNPDSPSSTVSIVRISESVLQYLTLGDSPIVIWDPSRGSQALLDDRTAHLPGGRPYTVELVRSLRNQSGGFWIASTKPDAAYHAVAGTAEFGEETEVGLFTDGASRLVEFYGYSWDSLFATLRKLGPNGLIQAVRVAEREQKPPHGKVHDDATAVHITYSVGVHPTEET
jgi:hypothetical protein